MNFLITLLLLTTLTQSYSLRLRFFGAAQSGGISSWTPGPVVTGGTFRVCRSSLPQPFTLACQTTSNTQYADFFVNGRSVRRESARPYMIAGDVAGVAAPWNPPNTVDVRCRLSNGEQVSATIIFTCGGGNAPPPAPAPRVTAPPVTAPPATTTRPSFGLNSGSRGRNCVRIPALSTSDRAGWTVQGGGLFYRPGDGSRDVTPAGRVIASYSFTAPADGRYGFTVDMSTKGRVDHNDVWVEFPSGGFILTRGGSSRVATGWTKAYHNSNGRSTQVFSVDFNPHTFATRSSLKKGTRYTVRVGGRSTRTGFFSIIMFPCSGGQCDGTNPKNNFWRQSRDACA